MSTVATIRERFISAVRRSDLDGILGCYQPNAVLLAPEGRFEGHEGLRTYFGPQFDAFSDLRLELTAVHDADDTGVAEWTFSGTSTGSLELPDGGTLAATGQRVTQRGIDVASVADGRIREHRLYYDQLELLQQLRPAAAGSR